VEFPSCLGDLLLKNRKNKKKKRKKLVILVSFLKIREEKIYFFVGPVGFRNFESWLLFNSVEILMEPIKQKGQQFLRILLSITAELRSKFSNCVLDFRLVFLLLNRKTKGKGKGKGKE